MRWLRYDIFLSYSQRDSAAVLPLADALRRRGYRVFLDKDSIIVGEQWKSRLANAMDASRVCILCWSEHAVNSEYVSFEYARAEASGKRVLPWLMDATPLPQMIEVQGIAERDPLKSVTQFLPRLGWRLSVRRLAQALGVLLLLTVSGIAVWRADRPPPPWEFTGRVVDSETRLSIPDVRVEAENNQFIASTDSQGNYVLHLPPPRPKYLRVVFAKSGYKGEEWNVPADQPFNMYMIRK